MTVERRLIESMEDEDLTKPADFGAIGARFVVDANSTPTFSTGWGIVGNSFREVDLRALRRTLPKTSGTTAW